MPIPGKKAGDPTNFNFDYFANSRVMALEAEALKAPFSETRRFTLAPRHSCFIGIAYTEGRTDIP